MKKSIYNYISHRSECTILYNSAVDRIVQIDERLAILYDRNSPENIKTIYPAFYDFLVDNCFLVDENLSEGNSVRERWIKEDRESDSFSIAVNPTLNCNMRCWYCYEDHSGIKVMTKEVMEKVKKSILKIIHESGKNHLHLGFFGGEPMLYFDKTVKPLMDFSLDETKKYSDKIKLSFSFVSNGSLVTENIVDYLKSTKCPVTFQITFDGNKDIHDKVRFYGNKEGSYDKIIDNIRMLVTIPNVKIIVRCNYTKVSLASFIDLADDMGVSQDLIESKRISIDLHRIWQDGNAYDSESIKDIESAVKGAFKNYGFHVSAPKRSSGYRCYADSINHVLINYNGDLYRCTARDFKPERREGILAEDGTFQMNTHSEERNQKRWGNKTCLTCRIYPICTGGCSQNILEFGKPTECLYNYSEDEKNRRIEERITILISRIIQPYA